MTTLPASTLNELNSVPRWAAPQISENFALEVLRSLPERDYRDAPRRFRRFAAFLLQSGQAQPLSDRLRGAVREFAAQHAGRVSLLTLALYRGVEHKEAVISLLLECGIPPDSRVSPSDLTPLSVAARTHQVGAMSILLRHGANPLLGGRNTYQVLNSMTGAAADDVRKRAFALLLSWATNGTVTPPAGKRPS